MHEPPRALICSWLGGKDTANFLHTHLPAPCKQKLKCKSGKSVLLENNININTSPTRDIFLPWAGSAVGAGTNQSKKETDTYGSASLPKRLAVSMMSLEFTITHTPALGSLFTTPMVGKLHIFSTSRPIGTDCQQVRSCFTFCLPFLQAKRRGEEQMWK